MAAAEDKPSSSRKSKKSKRELPSKAANLEKELKMVRGKLNDKDKKLKKMEAERTFKQQFQFQSTPHKSSTCKINIHH